MTDEYILSNHVFNVKRKDGYAVYHSIFGNLCLIDKKALDLLYSFKNKKTKQNVLDNFNNKTTKKNAQELIEEFEKRGFILKSGSDEFSDFKKYIKIHNQELKNGKEVCIIQLVVTNICNFHCKYCFVDTIYSSKERAKTQKDPENQMMKKQDAKRYIEIVINHIKKNKRKNLFIQFFGGEPLVNWPVVKYVLEEFSDGKKYDVNIMYSIITNGSLITDEIAKIFKKYGVTAIVSFDSPRGTDRVLANGKNSGELVKKKIALLHKYNNRIAFNSAMTIKTYPYFDIDLVDFAVKNGVSEIGIVFDFDLNFYEKYSTKEIVDKFWKFYKYAKKNNIEVTGYWHHSYQLILENKHYLQGGYRTCPAMGALLSIEPSGVVYTCKASSAYYGNINELDKIFMSKNYQKYGKHPFQKIKECVGCEIENFCSNICKGVREKNYNSIDMIHEPTCRINKQIIKKLIEDTDKKALSYLKIESE